MGSEWGKLPLCTSPCWASPGNDARAGAALACLGLAAGWGHGGTLHAVPSHVLLSF